MSRSLPPAFRARILTGVARRVLVEQVRDGLLRLGDAEAHHLRDVLRHNVGDAVEVFDAAGRSAPAMIETCTDADVSVRVRGVSDEDGGDDRLRLTIASAVPKANRADWMIEKLAELGVDVFVPLAAERSVVVPEGKNKLDRWRRLSVEASKQSHRIGVMRVDELRAPASALQSATGTGSAAWCLSTEPDFPVVPVLQAWSTLGPAKSLTVFVGPEGGWTRAELALFRSAGATPVRLTETILRIETAALTVASVVGCLLSRDPSECVKPS